MSKDHDHIVLLAPLSSQQDLVCCTTSSSSDLYNHGSQPTLRYHLAPLADLHCMATCFFLVHRLDYPAGVYVAESQGVIAAEKHPS